MSSPGKTTTNHAALAAAKIALITLLFVTGIHAWHSDHRHVNGNASGGFIQERARVGVPFVTFGKNLLGGSEAHGGFIQGATNGNTGLAEVNPVGEEAVHHPIVQCLNWEPLTLCAQKSSLACLDNGKNHLVLSCFHDTCGAFTPWSVCINNVQFRFRPDCKGHIIEYQSCQGKSLNDLRLAKRLALEKEREEALKREAELARQKLQEQAEEDRKAIARRDAEDKRLREEYNRLVREKAKKEAEEKERLEREAAEKAQKEKEAAERAQREAEEAEQRKREQEEAERAKKLEEEAAEKARQEAEAAEKARLEKEALKEIEDSTLILEDGMEHNEPEAEVENVQEPQEQEEQAPLEEEQQLPGELNVEAPTLPPVAEGTIAATVNELPQQPVTAQGQEQKANEENQNETKDEKSHYNAKSMTKQASVGLAAIASAFIGTYIYTKGSRNAQTLGADDAGFDDGDYNLQEEEVDLEAKIQLEDNFWGENEDA